MSKSSLAGLYEACCLVARVERDGSTANHCVRGGGGKQILYEYWMAKNFSKLGRYQARADEIHHLVARTCIEQRNFTPKGVILSIDKLDEVFAKVFPDYTGRLHYLLDGIPVRT